MAIDWTHALSFEQAARNVRSDTFGDWYRDPWGWPENEWVATKSAHFLSARLNDKGAKRALTIDVPKENFILRPATLLEPVDRLAYQALVDSLSIQLVGDLRGFVFGWRLPFENVEQGRYSRNSFQWQAFRTRLQELGDSHKYGLTTDITSFFQSVSINRLEEEICRVVKRNAVIDRLIDYLHSWQSIPSRSGLPQRCLASSILAQFYLRPVDDMLSMQNSPSTTHFQDEPVSSCRWMDDIWLFSNNRYFVRLVQLELQHTLWDLQLHLNGGKTTFKEGDDLRAAVREYEHSAADFGLRCADLEPLEKLIDEIVDSPDTASRTTIRFVTSRMRSHDVAVKMHRFVEEARRLPHGADHLARLFRDLEVWRDLETWYLDYLDGPGSEIKWTSYQLGTMFPSSEICKAIRDCFATRLSSGELPILMVPLAVQRLAAWIPDETRGLIQSIARNGTYEHPFALRALAFAGVEVGVPIATVKMLLQQFTETDVQLAFLESRNYKPLPVAEDFGGD